MKDFKAKVGDLVITNHGGGYSITKFAVTQNDFVYFATTLEASDYTGVAAYYSKECKSVNELVNFIDAEEGVKKIISREELVKNLFDFF